jgi:hypothetical protein
MDNLQNENIVADVLCQFSISISMYGHKYKYSSNKIIK